MMFRAAPPAGLYGLVVFTAAWLVFWVQPLSVRSVLPILGGSPAVWNTAMVFFQAAVLAGYGLAHLLATRVPPAGQLAVLGLLWAAAAAAAPIGGPRLLGHAPGDLPPVLWLLGTLAGALGPAVVAASCLTPLVQAWLARSGTGEAPVDPYFLYAASNAGSAGALLAYPFLLEPALGLEIQAWGWSAALLGLAPFLAFLWLALPAGRVAVSPRPASVPARQAAALPAWRILALSAVPSGLLLAVTRYLATDVASVPLLWVVPLAVYLGTFIHAFAPRTLIPHRVLVRLMAPGLIVLAIAYALAPTILAFGLLHLVVFALSGLYCHGALARLRPPASDLTRFYLLVSTGGLAGGLLVALAAPLLFVDVYEHPIALALVAALLPAAGIKPGRAPYVVGSIALALVLGGLALVHATASGFGEESSLLAGAGLCVTVLAAPALLAMRPRPVLLACALGAVFLVPSALNFGRDAHLARERTFFGVYRVIEKDGVRQFFHGTTLHGEQWLRADGSPESRTTYYGIGSPYYELMTSLARRPSPLVIGLAGLGTGSLACYARPGDRLRIYEIDPAVVRLARAHFAALSECAPKASFALGDARLSLEGEASELDVLALDTFSSDSIPVHLLTIEAFRVYLRVLAPDGVLAVHISNRYLDLEPVLASLAHELGLAARVKNHEAPEDASPRQPSLSSRVVVLARDEATLRALDLDAGWLALGSPDRVRVWTDDYTSILPLLRWW